MRTDETGQQCPETLGEYRDLCAALGGEDCDAVAWLDARIADQGPQQRVFAPDSQMRELLMPHLLTKNGKKMTPDDWKASQAKRSGWSG